jgi:hypothetical protein
MHLHKLPKKISAYIYRHYFAGYLSDIKSVKDKYGHVYYKINLHIHGVLHRLKFREEGNLIKHETEPFQGEFYFD